MASSLSSRLASTLGEVLSVDAEPDGALTVRHEGTLASLRVVSIAEDLELVALTQLVVWDLPLTKKVRDRVAEQVHRTLLGSVTLVEKPGKTADVMLRYNFPGAGLTDDALRTLVLLVLDNGIEIRRALSG